MRIECLTTFLDGRERFVAGDIFTIADADAARFVKAGWAKEVGAPTPSPLANSQTNLAVQNSVIGTGDNHG